MTWVVLAVVLLLVVVGVVLTLRQRRSRALRERFGPEYERVVEERGDQRQAEQELLGRRERRDRLEVRELEPADRERYLTDWKATQRRFVDEPASAVADADSLVTSVMRDRGYPAGQDFDERADVVSVDHPAVVEHYRVAHGISRAAAEQRAGTEDLRRAMVHYRALFNDLLGAGNGREAPDAPSEDRGEVS